MVITVGCRAVGLETIDEGESEGPAVSALLWLPPPGARITALPPVADVMPFASKVKANVVDMAGDVVDDKLIVELATMLEVPTGSTTTLPDRLEMRLLLGVGEETATEPGNRSVLL